MRRCEKLEGLSPPAFKSGGATAPPAPPSPTPLVSNFGNCSYMNRSHLVFYIVSKYTIERFHHVITILYTIEINRHLGVQLVWYGISSIRDIN